MIHLDRLIGALLLGAVLALPAGHSFADQKTEDLIKARSQHMKDVGGAVKAINDQLKTGMPDKAVVTDSAKKIAMLAHDQMNWFPKGSGPESGVKTLAKAEIWAQPADFLKAHNAFVTEADKLAMIAPTASVDELTAQVKALGGACGGCHKPFRTPPPPPPGQ